MFQADLIWDPKLWIGLVLRTPIEVEHLHLKMRVTKIVWYLGFPLIMKLT